MFNEFCRCNQNLKIKLSTAQQVEVFKHLAGEKLFIDFQDFCNLTEERRLKIDPAEEMLRIYRA
jgi:hypothetical protein